MHIEERKIGKLLMREKSLAALAKYRNLSLPVKAALWFTICNFLQKAFSLLTTPIFTRVLSTDEFGLVSTYYSLENVFVMFATLSLSKAMNNLYVKYEDKHRVMASVIGLSLSVSTCFLIIYLIFRGTIDKLLGIPTILILGMFASFIGKGVVQCWMTFNRYVYKYKAVVFVTLLITALSSMMAVVLVFFYSPTAESRLLPEIVVYIIIGAIIALKVFARERAYHDGEVWKFALAFSVPLLPHYLSEYVLGSSDKLMINYMCGYTDVAIYSLAHSVGTLVYLVTNAINSSFAPYEYQAISKEKYKELSKVSTIVVAIVATVLSLIMLFCPEIVMIFGGSKYSESVHAIIPICIGIFFSFVFQLFARVQEYYVRRLMVVIPSILCAGLNLVLNYIFIKKYGYIAAAYTTLVCYLTFSILHYLFYLITIKKELNGQRLYNIKQIVFISIGLAAVGIISPLLFTNYIVKYAILIVCIIFAIIFREKIIERTRGFIAVIKEK